MQGNGLFECYILIYPTFTSSLRHKGFPNLLFYAKSNFFFSAWRPNLPTNLWSGILIPTPPCPLASDYNNITLCCNNVSCELLVMFGLGAVGNYEVRNVLSTLCGLQVEILGIMLKSWSHLLIMYASFFLL